jgi:hypothetical protein
MVNSPYTLDLLKNTFSVGSSYNNSNNDFEEMSEGRRRRFLHVS